MMHRYINLLLVVGGVLGLLLSYLFRDQLVLSGQDFAFWIAFIRISSFALLFFLAITLLALGPRIVNHRLYSFGLFLVPALIPDLFHILSFVFFPDFITRNTRDKVAYLFILSRSLVVLALFVSMFHKRLFLSTKVRDLFALILLAFSLLLSFLIVFFYPHLPPLYIEGVGQPWYRDLCDLVNASVLLFLILYIHKRKPFGEKPSLYMATALFLLMLSSLSLALYKHFYDFLIVLSSFYRFLSYGFILYAVLYAGVRDEAYRIMSATRALLTSLMGMKPENREGVLYIRFGKGLEYIFNTFSLYDGREGRLLAVAYGYEEEKPPPIDVRSLYRRVRELGGQFFDRGYYYAVHEGYIAISKLAEETESPLIRLHVINTTRILLGHILSYINFERLLEEKSKELQRLYLILETSEYATQAYNNIDTFSKQVLERLDYVLKMDGSVFYMWNKNAEMPDRIIFSGGFIRNFPDYNLLQLAGEVIESEELYGIRKNYMFCKFESNSYQSGIIGLRKEGGFDKEDLLFLKTVSNQLFHVVKLMKVIEDLESAQASIRFLSEFDPLTMLYNRRSIEKLLEKEIERAERTGEPLCLLFVDVDNFKVINDAYGYATGDAVLKHVAGVIRNKIRRLDIAGRLGGDEFAVILPRARKNSAMEVARRLKWELENKPFLVGETVIPISISVGVVCYPVDAKSPGELISLGESLMHVIKKEGKGKVKAVEEADKSLHTYLIGFEKSLIESLEKGLVEPFFQEIREVESQRLVGFEVLARLRVGEELVPAFRFIHLAERMGIISRLDLTLMNIVFNHVKECKNRDFYLFFNLSPQNLTEDFVREVNSLVDAYAMEPSRLVFELTEREAIQDIEAVSSFVKNMREKGFKFAIDDFGSGYSSFLYLKYLPVDFLKIEGEFIRSLKTSNIDRVFVENVVNVARALGVKTVTEYVEEEVVLRLLSELNVDYAQGYYIGKPAPALEKLSLFSRDKDQEAGAEG